MDDLNQYNFYIEIFKIYILPVSIVFITGLFSYFIARIQIKIKREELDREYEMKVREKFFELRQMEIERKNESVNKLQETLSEFTGIIAADNAKNKKDDYLLVCNYISMYANDIKDEINLIKEQLKVRDMFIPNIDEILNKLDTVFNNNYKKAKPESYVENLFKVSEALAEIDSIRLAISNKNADEIFGKYIKDK